MPASLVGQAVFDKYPLAQDTYTSHYPAKNTRFNL